VRQTSIANSRIIGIAITLYLLVVVVASLHFNLSLSPDRLIILFLIAALGTGRVRLFLKDWSIFFIVLLAWQVLSGMSRSFGHFQVHVGEMIAVDKFLFFGQIPTIWLQHHFDLQGHFTWYDLIATTLYFLHFVLPMAVAFAFWYWNRPIFLEFMVSFMLLALAGFATYVLFPAAPPWIAGNKWHLIPHVHKILDDGIAYFGGQMSLSALYSWMYNNKAWDIYGAVPSEHAAFPFLCFLYARRAWGGRGWVLFPYCMVVWVAVVYLGEHWVTDVIVGVGYAAVAYAVVQVLEGRKVKTKRSHPVAPAEPLSQHVSA